MGRFLFLSLGLLVVALSLPGTGADHPCPPGWISFDHFCYNLIRQWKTWADAEISCSRLESRSHLASIQSWAESDFVAGLLSNSVSIVGVWIGLNDLNENGTWKWSDGSQFGYTSWEEEEPNNIGDKKQCIGLTRGSGFSGWKVVHCESESVFICKFQSQSAGSA